MRLLYVIVLALLCIGCQRPIFQDFKKVSSNFQIFKSSKKHIVRELQRQDIQYVEYGDTMTLVVPTDHYFVTDSAELNDICYAGLNNIVKLLKMYPHSRVFVAGFTDDVGTAENKKHLSTARAEAMLTFLWAHGIPAKQVQAKGYGDLCPLGDNKLIHASAFNRRIEIQWFAFRVLENQQARRMQAYHGMK